MTHTTQTPAAALAAGVRTEVALGEARAVLREALSLVADFNLELLHIVGAGGLLDENELDVPRSAMPQLPETPDELRAYRSWMRTECDVESSVVRCSPLQLVVTQNELDAREVEAIVSSCERTPSELDRLRATVLPTASNGAVLDGHHRLAASVLLAAEDLLDVVTTLRFGADVRTCLRLASRYADCLGTAHRSFGDAVYLTY